MSNVTQLKQLASEFRDGELAIDDLSYGMEEVAPSVGHLLDGWMVGPIDSEDWFSQAAEDLSDSTERLHGIIYPEQTLDDLMKKVNMAILESEPGLFLSTQGEDAEFSFSMDSGEDSAPFQDFLERIPSCRRELPAAPDISGALGKRIEKLELKALEQFAMEQVTFAVFGEELYAYSPPCWQRLDAHTCTIRLKRLFCAHELDRHLGSGDYKELYRSLLTNPQLQRGAVPEPPLHRLNLLDCTLDLENLTFYEHNPEEFFQTCLNLTRGELLEPGDGTLFEEFISGVSNGDPAVRQQVLELIALACTGYQIKAFYVLVGPSGTGKSQLSRFLVELLGHDQVASVGGIHELGGKFAMADMDNKSLAVCLDLPNTTLPANAIGALKVAVGSDAKKIECKYKNPKTIYRSPLWLFATNFPLQIPNVEQEDAFLQRMVMIPFLHAVPPEKQVQQLYKRLLEESAYIVRESVKAYKALLDNNFALTRAEIPPEYSPGEAREAVLDIQVFLDEYCVKESEATITTERLYQEFMRRTNSVRTQYITKIAFGRVLSEILQRTDGVFEVKRAENSERRGYRGIRLREQGQISTALATATT